jgi:hypothetical protein
MAKRRDDGEGQGGRHVTKKAPEETAETDDCRCKEVSKKTPRELLKVMVGDLSFWKKKK